LEPLPDGPEGITAGLTQDFVLVSHPTFFMKDARDYAIFRSIVDSRVASKLQELRMPTLKLLLKAGVFSARRPREVAIFLRTLLRRIHHPLRIEYHSALASLHGDGLAVKYSVRPIDEHGNPLKDDLRAKRSDANYLREALKRSLDPARGTGPLYLEFSAHVPRGGQSLSVEDPRRHWSERMAPRVRLARIVIEPQDFTTTERMQLAEALVFTPWHALGAHKPLGSLNRARLMAYAASADARSELNGTALGDSRRSGIRLTGTNGGPDRGPGAEPVPRGERRGVQAL
jgi:hypothetical protein